MVYDFSLTGQEFSKKFLRFAILFKLQNLMVSHLANPIKDCDISPKGGGLVSEALSLVLGIKVIVQPRKLVGNGGLPHSLPALGKRVFGYEPTVALIRAQTGCKPPRNGIVEPDRPISGRIIETDGRFELVGNVRMPVRPIDRREGGRWKSSFLRSEKRIRLIQIEHQPMLQGGAVVLNQRKSCRFLLASDDKPSVSVRAIRTVGKQLKIRHEKGKPFAPGQRWEGLLFWNYGPFSRTAKVVPGVPDRTLRG